jgi:hypothetical protein
MNLLNFIFFMLCGAWLIGFAWASVIAFRSRKTSDKTTLKTNKSLNVKIGEMNASKLTTTDLGKDKQ